MPRTTDSTREFIDVYTCSPVSAGWMRRNVCISIAWLRTCTGSSSSPPGEFHGSENHGVALPPGRCSSALLSSPPRFWSPLVRFYVCARVSLQGVSAIAVQLTHGESLYAEMKVKFPRNSSTFEDRFEIPKSVSAFLNAPALSVRNFILHTCSTVV